MAAVSEEAKANARAASLRWYYANKSPERNRQRYLAAKAKETAEQREKRNAKAREKRQRQALERQARETEADRLAKKQRWLAAITASNKARAKAPEELAQPKPRTTKMTPHQAILSNKRKPGRLVALSGWRGTGF
jgi:hypothetical protein